jgi:hypothetical protein
MRLPCFLPLALRKRPGLSCEPALLEEVVEVRLRRPVALGDELLGRAVGLCWKLGDGVIRRRSALAC